MACLEHVTPQLMCFLTDNAHALMHASITNFEASDGIAVIHNLVILYVNFVGEKCTSTLIKDSFVGREHTDA